MHGDARSQADAASVAKAPSHSTFPTISATAPSLVSNSQSGKGVGKRLLITAGPTHETIDAVRYIGNRSSGKMGIALADAAAAQGWDVTLLLGPVSVLPTSLGVRVLHFRTCENLRELLAAHVALADVLIMAAAVADYRPKVDPAFQGGKFRRTDQKMVFELEPTPDLLAEVARSRRPEQLMVGFALEPHEQLLASANAKLIRKKVDLVVANPLETMDSSDIEGMIVSASGVIRPEGAGLLPKAEFAAWLMRRIEESLAALKQSQKDNHSGASAQGSTGTNTTPGTNSNMDVQVKDASIHAAATGTNSARSVGG